MVSPEEMQDRDDNRKLKLAKLVNELKVQWLNYAPRKRVDFIKRCPEVCEKIIEIIEHN